MTRGPALHESAGPWCYYRMGRCAGMVVLTYFANLGETPTSPRLSLWERQSASAACAAASLAIGTR